LASNKIEVYYQPKLSLFTQKVESLEALVRWNDQRRGFIPPDRFIGMAERADRIAPLTLYILERVASDLADLRQSHTGMKAAINISARLLSSAEFNVAAEEIIGSSGVPPEALIFEVTESATLLDPDASIAALRRYRDLGIAVSMDDYGTGQSTLTYLRTLPLNELKIDRSFVQHVHENRSDALLVRSTIALAHDLGIKVVAEGVEDAACLEVLRSYDCDMVQGYFISRPLPLHVLAKWLDEPLRDAA
jgi:EAL domain-containing protein (putative c-di-GMP-specific phosphodiesterase class I)